MTLRWKLVIAILACIIIGLALVIIGLSGQAVETLSTPAMSRPNSALPRSEPTCTMRHPMGPTVQMFLDPVNNPFAITDVADGTVCSYQGDFQYTEAGITIPLYRVTCNGQQGYVNQKWATCQR